MQIIDAEHVILPLIYGRHCDRLSVIRSEKADKYDC